MNNQEEIRLLIVDDEKEACDNLIAILSDYIDANITILGVAHDTTQAHEQISKLNPNTVFLDIEMPGENAFQFLERIWPVGFEIIFITAYDEFAIKAFKLNAVDYILKPVDIEDLATAIVKLKNKMQYKHFLCDREHHLSTIKQVFSKSPSQRICLRALNRLEVVDFNNIYYLEGRGSYCVTTFKKSGSVHEITTSFTLSYYEELLPAHFYRIHKSFIVNCRHIKSIVSGEGHHLILSNEQHIPVSRRRFNIFIDFLRQNKLYQM